MRVLCFPGGNVPAGLEQLLERFFSSFASADQICVRMMVAGDLTGRPLQHGEVAVRMVDAEDREIVLNVQPRGSETYRAVSFSVSMADDLDEVCGHARAAAVRINRQARELAITENRAALTRQLSAVKGELTALLAVQRSRQKYIASRDRELDSRHAELARMSIRRAEIARELDELEHERDAAKQEAESFEPRTLLLQATVADLQRLIVELGASSAA